MDAIILAGGFGTRLQEVVSEVPKPLAPICGRPFLELLFSQLRECKDVSRVVLAVGHKSHLIVEYCEKKQPPIPYVFSFETSPLGTGGALRKAAEFTSSQDILVLNGDSYLAFSWPHFIALHRNKKADMTIACLEVCDVFRYGQVKFDPVTQMIRGFEEKGGSSGPGWINGGVYLIKKEIALQLPYEKSFSLEKEGMPVLSKKNLFAYPCQGTFIDIGTKESYYEAQHLLKEIACSTF